MPTLQEKMAFASTRLPPFGVRSGLNAFLGIAHATAPSGFLIAHTFAEGTAAVEQALANNPNRLNALDLKPLQQAYEQAGSPDFFSWIHPVDYGHALLFFDIYAKSLTFPQSTVYDHESDFIRMVAGFHNLLNAMPQTESKNLNSILSLIQSIPRAASFVVAYCATYTFPMVPETLRVIATGAEVDGTALVPGLLGILAGIDAAYNLVVLTTSIAQYYQHPPIKNEKPIPDIPATRPQLPAPQNPNLLNRVINLLKQSNNSEEVVKPIWLTTSHVKHRSTLPSPNQPKLPPPK